MDNENFTVDFGEVTNVGGGGTSDFNELTNRPKYDSNIMSGDTNIPKVPSKTSDLTNDSDYQTETEVSDAISTAIGAISIPTKTSDLTNDGADGQSTYVETDDLAAVATSGSYADLENKPSIPTVNDATLTITQNGTSKGTFTANDADDTTIEVSDTTYSNFTGTDGSAAGAAGLVPAPATTDAGKFLKADGTWDSAGGGGPTVVQTTGTSTTNVMSQDATTKMIYSTANPSTYAQGGAIYMGNLNSNQEQQPDPALTDRDWKYFWALPADNTIKPQNNSINILGRADGGNAITIGANGARAHGNNGVAIGGSAKCGQSSVALGAWANAGETGSNITGMVAIGYFNQANESSYSIALGANSGSGHGVMGNQSANSITIGKNATINNLTNSVALGAYAQPTRQGEVNVGLVQGETTGGYNSTAYRVIGGVHDGQLANDAVTVGQINALIDAINSAAGTNISHIGS